MLEVERGVLGGSTGLCEYGIGWYGVLQSLQLCNVEWVGGGE